MLTFSNFVNPYVTKSVNPVNKSSTIQYNTTHTTFCRFRILLPKASILLFLEKHIRTYKRKQRLPNFEKLKMIFNQLIQHTGSDSET